MSKPTLLSLLTIVAALAVPLEAAAYAPPRDIFFTDNWFTRYILPPSRREVQERVTAQRERSTQQREEAQTTAWGSNSSAPTTASNTSAQTHAAADLPPEFEEFLKRFEETLTLMQEGQEGATASESAGEDTEGEGSAGGALDPRTQRILDRLERRGEFHVAAPEETLETMHKGAPLVGTGPESWLALGVMLIAIGWTLHRSRRATAMAMR